ncbi:Exopolyphosphatase; Guanosine-5 prime-triphosphate,3 prime-diphosphate diphosphatase [Synechococcus sp. WH 8103]|uniref:Exopolyphosphatase n=1 Tax=Parasynechococcus marenigrum (strain WH8102) TaxID=84588 RepID=Q7U562_PARMW|nr:Ppx/GppA phosphatase family protein [Parasynechococcus marenigrum]CAE08361.1 putative exopolyphosphatase [Parasynechococcus marenigrum WH 8102]CRY92817.1 Exopolyphosphatase; Guanosine-5 prime-triphosphate,3 prime-diphosphate diphosphatase [Synechococcus sp. WH 8103]
MLDAVSESKAPAGSQPTRSSAQTRRVAAIDIGTNSTHLLVASVDTTLGTFSIEQAEKSTTRLGERDPDSGELTPAGMQRGYETLRRFRDLAISHDVEQIVTAATSAVREAPNGREFLQSIQDGLGMDVDLVSGPEEARLIYLGVLSGMSFGDRPHLLLDIGGGSTELILADGRDARALTSTRVGAVRLQRDFVKDDPIPPQRRSFLQAFIQGSLEPAVDKVHRRIKPGEIPVLVATSGTAMAIGALAASEDDRPPLKLHGYRVSRQRLDRVVEKLVTMTPEQRRDLSPINDRRAEIIVPGALILQTTMQMLGVDELVLSERALREGLIVDWMLRHGLLEDRFSFQSSIRQRTVIHQVQRFAVNQRRAERVATHALSLYDATEGLMHQDDGQGRELLWAAAMLHACGQHINLSAYHKHSWYLIRHGELLGYSEAEHLMVAAIARYHRRSLPKKRHESWQALVTRDNRRRVSEMALLLRLAAALDRRPEPVVASLRVNTTPDVLDLVLVPERLNQNLSLEQWSLESCAEVVREASGVKLRVSVQG